MSQPPAHPFGQCRAALCWAAVMVEMPVNSLDQRVGNGLDRCVSTTCDISAPAAPARDIGRVQWANHAAVWSAE
ncbi:MAG: hypothetical protein R3D99_06755 [Altererythrobacter sp.]